MLFTNYIWEFASPVHGEVVAGPAVLDAVGGDGVVAPGAEEDGAVVGQGEDAREGHVGDLEEFFIKK